MKRRLLSFNIYFARVCLGLCLGLALWLGSGCASSSSDSSPGDEKKMHKKEQSTIRLYLEGGKAEAMSSGTVMVTSNRFLYTIDREPFLSEADLATASIIDHPDGTFSIELALDDHATLVLDMTTAANKGKHIIVFAQFPKPGKKEKAEKKKKDDDTDDSDLAKPENRQPKATKGPRESGWLAAVLIRSRIPNGLFIFTPDASREEGIRIVRGLRNVLAKKKNDKF